MSDTPNSEQDKYTMQVTGDHNVVVQGNANIVAILKMPLDPKSLRDWWHGIIREHGKYSCYAILLALPSDKEAIRYCVEFGKELDLLSGENCMVLTVTKTDFKFSGILLDKNSWALAIDEQISEGHSLKIAKLFGIDFADFPCFLLFRDIRSLEYVTISLKGMAAEEISAQMRKTFSLIHRAADEKQSPLDWLDRNKNKAVLLEKGHSAVDGVRKIAEKSFEVVLESWIKAVVK